LPTLLAFLECKFNSYFCYALALELADDPSMRGLLVGRAGNPQAIPVIPVVAPRGLPADLDVVLRKLADAESDNAHQHTWLNLGEVEEVRQRYQIEHGRSDPAIELAIAAMREPMARDCRLILWLNRNPPETDTESDVAPRRAQLPARTTTSARPTETV
jgi:hypothetical protein